MTIGTGALEYHVAFRVRADMTPIRDRFTCERHARQWVADMAAAEHIDEEQIDVLITRVHPLTGHMCALYQATAHLNQVHRDMLLLAEAVDVAPAPTGRRDRDLESAQALIPDYARAKAWAAQADSGILVESQLRADDLSEIIRELVEPHLSGPELASFSDTIDDVAQAALEIAKSGGGLPHAVNAISHTDRARKELDRLVAEGISASIRLPDEESILVLGVSDGGWGAVHLGYSSDTLEPTDIDIVTANSLPELLSLVETGLTVRRGEHTVSIPPTRLSPSTVAPLNDYVAAVDRARDLVRVTAARRDLISTTAVHPPVLADDQRRVLDLLRHAAEVASVGEPGLFDELGHRGRELHRITTAYRRACEVGIGLADIKAALTPESVKPHPEPTEPAGDATVRNILDDAIVAYREAVLHTDSDFADLAVGDDRIREIEQRLVGMRSEIGHSPMPFELNVIASEIARWRPKSDWSHVHVDELWKAIGDAQLTDEQAHQLRELTQTCREASLSVSRRQVEADTTLAGISYRIAVAAAESAGISRGHITAIARRGFAESVPDTTTLDTDTARAELLEISNHGVEISFADPRDPYRVLTVGFRNEQWFALDRHQNPFGPVNLHNDGAIFGQHRSVADLIFALEHGAQSGRGTGERLWPAVPIPVDVRVQLDYLQARLDRLDEKLPVPGYLDQGQAWEQSSQRETLEVRQLRDIANPPDLVRFTDPVAPARSVEIVMRNGQWIAYEYTSSASDPGSERRNGILRDSRVGYTSTISDLDIRPPFRYAGRRTSGLDDPIVLIPDAVRTDLVRIQHRFDDALVAAVAAGVDATAAGIAVSATTTQIDASPAKPYRVELTRLDSSGVVVADERSDFGCGTHARRFLYDGTSTDAEGMVIADITRADPTDGAPLRILHVEGTPQLVTRHLELLSEVHDDWILAPAKTLGHVAAEYDQTAQRLGDRRLAELRLDLLIHLDDLREQFRQLIQAGDHSASPGTHARTLRDMDCDATVPMFDLLTANRAARDRAAATNALFHTARAVSETGDHELLDALEQLRDISRELAVDVDDISDAIQRGADAGRPNGQDLEEEPFDFWRDVIGDDLVVGGVVYSSDEYELDGEGDVQLIADRIRRDTAAAVNPLTVILEEIAATERQSVSFDIPDPDDTGRMITLHNQHRYWEVIDQRVTGTSSPATESKLYELDYRIRSVDELCADLADPVQAARHDRPVIIIPDDVRAALDRHQGELDHFAELRDVAQQYTNEHIASARQLASVESSRTGWIPVDAEQLHAQLPHTSAELASGAVSPLLSATETPDGPTLSATWNCAPEEPSTDSGPSPGPGL